MNTPHPACGHDHRPNTHHAWPPPCRVTAVLLAAGRASRMNAPKGALPLKAPWGEPPGEPAAQRIARLCREADLGRLIAVLGHHADTLRPLLAPLAHTLAIHPDPDQPMFSSVQIGLRLALARPTPPEAILIWPVDAPLLRLDALLTLLQSAPAHLAQKPHLPWVRLPAHTRRPDRPGHPVLLSLLLARHIAQAPPSSRLDHLLREPGVLKHTVLVEDPHVTLNLNTRADALPFLHKNKDATPEDTPFFP